MPRANPLRLNTLQLKTLTILQELARLEGRHPPGDDAEEGALMVTRMPHAYGDHCHLGEHVVLSKDATGLFNPAPWKALERNGLILSYFPQGAVVTAAGMAYDTGMRDAILHRSGH